MNKKVLRNKSFLMSNTVNRKKMYKAGKQWIIGNALVLAVLGGASAATHASAHADTNNNNTPQTVRANQNKPTISNIQKPTSKAPESIQPTNKVNNGTQPKPSTPTPKKVTKQANNVHQNLVDAMQNSQNNGNNKTEVENPKPKQPVNPNQSPKVIKNSATKLKSLGESNLTRKFKKRSNITTQTQPSDNHWIYDNGNYINTMPKTDTISNGTYDGLNYKYDKTLQAVEFTNGTMDKASTANFLSGEPSFNPPNTMEQNYNDVIKSIKFDSNINSNDVTDMHDMFYMDSALKSLDISHLDTSNVTDMHSMVYSDRALQNLDISHLDTSDVTNMRDMFLDDSALKNLDVSHFDTSSVTDMSGMFANDSALRSLDVNNFDTSNVTYMLGMFANDSALTNLNVSNFDTSNVTYMTSMFLGDSALKNLDISHLDTSNVTNMHDMFRHDSTLQVLTLPRSFNTSKVPDSDSDMMKHMFQSDTSLNTIIIQSPNTKIYSDANIVESTIELPSTLNTLSSSDKASLIKDIKQAQSDASDSDNSDTYGQLLSNSDASSDFTSKDKNYLKPYLSVKPVNISYKWYKKDNNDNYTSINSSDLSHGTIGIFIHSRNIPEDIINYKYDNQTLNSHKFIGDNKHYDNNGYTPLTYSDLSSNAPAGYDLLNAGNIPFDGNTHNIYMSPKIVGGTATINLIYQRGNHSYIRKAYVNLSSNIGDLPIKINPEDYDKVGYHLVSPKSPWSIPFDYSDVNSVSHGDLSRYNVENTFVYQATQVGIDIKYVDTQTGNPVSDAKGQLSDIRKNVGYDGDLIDLENDNGNDEITIDGKSYNLNIPTGYHLAHANNYIRLTPSNSISMGNQHPMMLFSLSLTPPAHHSVQPSTPSTTPTSSATSTASTNVTPIPSDNNTTVASNSAVLPQVSSASSSANQVSSATPTSNSSIASASPTFVASNTSKVQPKTNTNTKPSNNVAPKSAVPTLSSNSSQIKPIHQVKKSNHYIIPMVQQTIPHSSKSYKPTRKNNIDNTSHSVAVAKPTKSSTTHNSPINTQLFATKPLINNNSAESNNALKATTNSNPLNNNEANNIGKLPQTNEATNYAGITAMVALMLGIGLAGVDLKRRYE